MRMRIDSTWLTAAIGIAAAGMALMYPSAGIALLVLAAAVLLAGVRVEDSHIIWLSRGTHRRYIGIALLCARSWRVVFLDTMLLRRQSAPARAISTSLAVPLRRVGVCLRNTPDRF
jgi:hypothetical protein